MTEPAAPSLFDPEISADVDKVILHALAKKPEERFAQISNFANALQQALLHNKENSPGQKPLELTIYPSSGPFIPTPNVLVPATLASYDTSPPPDPIMDKDKNTPPPPPLLPLRPLPSTSSRLRRRIFVIVGLALLVVLSSIIVLATYQNNVRQSNVHATASVHAATSQAQNAVTATALAGDAATATANPYPSYLAGSGGNLALYNESLGQCHDVNLSLADTFNDCYISNTAFSNFAFEVQMTITRGDCGGMLFRADKSVYKYYYYEVCQDGSFRLIKYAGNTSGNATSIVISTSSSINTVLGIPNTIAVVASNDSITLYINHQKVYNIQDGSYANGQLALFASDLTNATDVTFSNARVWTF